MSFLQFAYGSGCLVNGMTSVECSFENVFLLPKTVRMVHMKSQKRKEGVDLYRSHGLNLS